MRRHQRPVPSLIVALLLSLATVCPAFVAADTPANVPSLTISQLKITSSSGQFITLYNATDTTLDMSKYQLEYFNHYDLSKATSSRLIALSGSVPPHGYYMINDSALLLCYQLTVNSVSLGLSSTAGFIEVLSSSQATPGGPVTPVLQDYAGWSKTAAAGAQTLPSNTSAFLQRQPLDAQYNPSVISPGAGSWQTVQPDPKNPCNLVTGLATSTPVQTGLNQLLAPNEPLATIVDLASEIEETSKPGIPAADIGLMAPQITELLPNPSGTGNDTTDEFIELYNSNSKPFDLTGFVLQTGVSSPRSYTFPAGSSLPPESFTSFYAEVTGLSLSNTGSQARLLDPLGNTISSSETYTTAKDGQSWALAKGKWYWTTQPTPSSANIIKQPVTAKKTKAATKAKAAKTTTAKVTAGTTTKPTAAAATGFAVEEPPTTPVHVWTLALVVGLALLYGTYEYRADMANRLHQFRRYLSARRSDR